MKNMERKIDAAVAQPWMFSWTVTIAEAQGDKSGSDEAWEHWMERRKCGHLQTQNSDVLKELWKRRRSKGKLWFTSGFEGTLMDIKCY